MDLQTAEKELLEQLLNDPTLTGLLETCARLLGTPICYVSHSGTDGFILSEGYPAVDVILAQIALEKQSAENKTAFQRYLEQVEMKYGTDPFLLPGQEGMASRLLCLVRTADHRMGLLSLPEDKLPLKEVNQPLMGMCARCLGLRVSQAMQDEDISIIRRSMFMLLSSRTATYSDILGHAGSLTPPRKSARRLLIIRAPEENQTRSFGALVGQIARLLSTQWYSFVKNEGAVLLPDSTLTPETAGEIPRLLALENCTACLSPVYRDLMETALWRRRLNILPVFRNAAPGTLTDYSNWLDWGIIGETNLNTEQLEGFLPAELLAMRDWDRLRGTDYLPTLSAFIRHYGNRRETAAALKTHVNTVIYRLQKMEELFGLDFSAPETLIHTVFALRLMEYLNQLE